MIRFSSLSSRFLILGLGLLAASAFAEEHGGGTSGDNPEREACLQQVLDSNTPDFWGAVAKCDVPQWLIDCTKSELRGHANEREDFPVAYRSCVELSHN